MNNVQVVPIGLLDESIGNENVMSSERFDLLCKAIREVGFLQPILAERAGDRWRIVDGVHRKRAAAIVGLQELPCVEFDSHAKSDEVAVRIGMNNLRGSLDLSAVASSVAQLQVQGWSVEDLTLTGFTVDELDQLLSSTKKSITEDILDSPTTQPAPLPEPGDKPFVLELRYATKNELARAKKGLRKAVGKHGDIADGLLRLLEGA